jgi:5-methylcytosine-specific restriction endonuclease McrA
MFDVEGTLAWETKPFFKQLEQEDFLWFLEDVVEASNRSELFGKSDILGAMETCIDQIGNLYDANEEAYWAKVKGDGRRKAIKIFSAFCCTHKSLLPQMSELYASDVADRILHDRELCHFIAQTVMDIGFDGETVDGLRTQWVDRENWPTWVRSILRARDRGKCAICGTDIVQELRGKEHIDHMFPIAGGGCNDLVNLQLLCSKCNLAKSDETVHVASSIPEYIRRSSKRVRPPRS